MPFEINGLATSVSGSISPMSQHWIDIIVGVDHNGNNLYSSFKECELGFDSCTLEMHQRWLEAASVGTSLTSITILDQASLNLRTFNGPFLRPGQRPTIEAGVAMGPWSMIVSGLQP